MPVTASAPPTLIHEHPNLQGGLALSPDGRRVAVMHNSRTSDESAVVIVDAESGGERTLVRRPYSAAYWRLAWSPDGRTLAAVSGNADSSGEHMNVVALAVNDGSEKVITPHPMAFLGNLAWLSESSGLLMVATDKLPRTDQLWYLSYPAGIARRLTNDVDFYSTLSLHPNSTALVTSQSRRRRNVWIAPVDREVHAGPSGSIETGRARHITSGYARLTWVPDGQLVYSSIQSGTVEIWRAKHPMVRLLDS